MLVTQSCPTLCDPHGPLQAPLSMGFSRPEYWSGQPFPSPGDLPLPGIEPRTPKDSLPAKPPGKPKNTGVGSLAPLQGIFLTQELKWSLLHCRQILYQLRFQGSPYLHIFFKSLFRAHLSEWVLTWPPYLKLQSAYLLYHCYSSLSCSVLFWVIC